MQSDRLEQARRDFDKIDKNKDGKISKEEFEDSIRENFGVEPVGDEFQKVLELFDHNKDGLIEFDEFLEFIKFSVLQVETMVRREFEKADLNGDGYISKDEMRESFRRAGKNVSEDHLDVIFRSFDRNNDGCVDYDEFLNAFRSNDTAVLHKHTQQRLRQRNCS